MVELLRSLRRKRLQKLDQRQGDLKYLSQLGLDAKDAQLAKEKAHIESSIAHWDVKLTTAKFLHDKVYISSAVLFASFHHNYSSLKSFTPDPVRCVAARMPYGAVRCRVSPLLHWMRCHMHGIALYSTIRRRTAPLPRRNAPYPV